MKRLYYLSLCFFLIGSIFVGFDTFSNRQYETLINDKFDQAIYLDTNLDYMDFFVTMAHYSEQFDLDIEKVEYISNAGRGIQQVINVYLLLDNPDWFQKEFSLTKGVNPANLESGQFVSSVITNSPKQKDILPLLYNASKIYLRPFSDLENRQIAGKYNIHMNNSAMKLQTILDIINQEGKITVHSEWLSNNVFTSYNQNMNIFYRWVLQTLLFVTILVLFAYLWSDLYKQIAVQKLFGYTNKKILFDVLTMLVLRPITFVGSITLLVVLCWLFYTGIWTNTAVLSLYLQTIILLFVLFMTILLVVLSLYSVCYLFIKWNNQQSLSTILKGKNKTTIIFLQSVKIISAIGITTAFVFCLLSFSLLWEDENNFSYWEKYGHNYVNFSLYVPDYIMKDEKLFAKIGLGISEVWAKLNQNGSIMFEYSEGAPLNDDKRIYIDGKETKVPFAYINRNYLLQNPIVDMNGNSITTFDESNDNEITILMPEKYKDEEVYLQEKLHYKHVKDRFIAESIYNQNLTGKVYDWKEKLNDPEITEKIVYISDNQQIFSYSIIDNMVDNPIMACVNSTNMGSNVYLPSIFNGGMKVWYENLDQLDREMEQVFQTAGCGLLTRRYVPLFESKADRIFLFRSAFYSSVILLILGAIILSISLTTFIHIYLNRNRKKIAVQHALGFSLLKIHQQLYLSIFKESLILCLIVSVIYYFSLYKYAGVKYFPFIVLLSIIITLLDMGISTAILKKEQQKVIVNTLKGE